MSVSVPFTIIMFIMLLSNVLPALSKIKRRVKKIEQQAPKGLRRYGIDFPKPYHPTSDLLLYRERLAKHLHPVLIKKTPQPEITPWEAYLAIRRVGFSKVVWRIITTGVLLYVANLIRVASHYIYFTSGSHVHAFGLDFEHVVRSRTPLFVTVVLLLVIVFKMLRLFSTLIKFYFTQHPRPAMVAWNAWRRVEKKRLYLTKKHKRIVKELRRVDRALARISDFERSNVPQPIINVKVSTSS